MPQPLAPILPSPPEVSIVTSARSIPGLNSDAWAYGHSSREDLCLPLGSWGRCVPVDDENPATKDVNSLGDTDLPEFFPWTIYSSFTCTSLADWQSARASAVASLKAKTPFAVARELWTGAVSGSASLQSTAEDITGGDGATDAVAVAQSLIANFQDCTEGSQATLHVPSIVIEQLTDQGYVTRSGNRLLTITGDIVIPGPGYPNSPGAWGPNGSPGPAESAAGEVWMYVTGPVELEFSETWEVGSGDPPAATFARMNRSELLVERDAIFRFPTCCVFAALATRSA